MNYLTNTDFISVGIAVAGNLMLGFILFFNNRHSATGVLFLVESFVISFWSIANYLAYKVIGLTGALWAERSVMFLAVPTSIVFLLLMVTFPEEKFAAAKAKWFWPLVTLGAVTMGVALSPFLFPAVEVLPGIITPQPVVGWGMAFFVPAAVLTIPLGIWVLIRKYLKAQGEEQLQLRYVMMGVITMFTFIVLFNFIFPAVFQDTMFIPLSSLFTFPFFAFTAYAVLKHHLLHAKVLGAEALAFVLTVVTLLEVVTSANIFDLVVHAAVFCLVLAFGIMLVQSVQREVAQREQLADLSRFKSELLSLASHQMRSPLAAMKGFLTLIMDGTYGAIDPKVKDALGKVRNSAEDLISLINTLLDVRRVEEGKMEYTFARADASALASGVVEGLQPLANEKKLQLTFAGPSAPVFVNADAEKLKQVFQNLVDNAIKYTPSGFVKVGMESVGGKITFTVSDSGLGIPKELIPYLFEEFIRDERVKKSIRGTGLGLYIARKILEAHDGKIAASSDGEGKGSQFTVTLPEMAPAPQPAPPPKAPIA